MRPGLGLFEPSGQAKPGRVLAQAGDKLHADRQSGLIAVRRHLYRRRPRDIKERPKRKAVKSLHRKRFTNAGRIEQPIRVERVRDAHDAQFDGRWMQRTDYR